MTAARWLRDPDFQRTLEHDREWVASDDFKQKLESLRKRAKQTSSGTGQSETLRI
jgi:hypothetical protein